MYNYISSSYVQLQYVQYIIIISLNACVSSIMPKEEYKTTSINETHGNHKFWVYSKEV